MSSADNDGGHDMIGTAKGVVGVVGELMKVAGDNPDVRQAGSELGKAALTVSKTINAVLLPMAALNFAVDKARDYFRRDFPIQLAEKAALIPAENLVEPKASIAGPALQALAFSHEERELRELYLNLLRSAMDSRTATKTHPAFVEVSKQLTSEEAPLLDAALQPAGISLVEMRVVKAGKNGHHVAMRHLAPLMDDTGGPLQMSNFPVMVDNWVRLGLVEARYDLWYEDEVRYAWVETRPEVMALRAASKPEVQQLVIQRGYMDSTAFGRQFAQALGLGRETNGVLTIAAAGVPSGAASGSTT